MINGRQLFPENFHFASGRVQTLMHSLAFLSRHNRVHLASILSCSDVGAPFRCLSPAAFLKACIPGMFVSVFGSDPQFLNSVRLWDFIEEREQRGGRQYDGEVSELGELFMQLSGAGHEGTPH